MAEMGRPTKLTPEVHRKIIQALSLGNYRKDAAAFAGIDAATLRRWMALGRADPEGPNGALYQEAAQAQALAKVTALGCITKAIRDGDWRAAAWYLQRLHPEQFSERSQLYGIAKALEQIEAAAEAAGVVVPEGLWEKAWSDFARDFMRQAKGVPGALGKLELPSGEEELDAIDVSEQDRKALLRVVRAAKNNKPQPPPETDPEENNP